MNSNSDIQSRMNEFWPLQLQVLHFLLIWLSEASFRLFTYIIKKQSFKEKKLLTLLRLKLQYVEWKVNQGFRDFSAIA